MSSKPRPIQSVTNAELYNRWAKVYDTDGNILQSIDDLLLPPLLTQVFAQLSSTSSTITVAELGCGTGRNTVKLLSTQSPTITTINALDLSPGMLAVARERCSKCLLANESIEMPPLASPIINFHEFDACHPPNFPDVQSISGTADLVLSTLVLEHLPIDVFFRTVKNLLKSTGGYLLLTNMHAEMGRISQAGFLDESTGQKVRGTSYAHEIEAVVEEGRELGFSVVGELGKRGIEERDIGSVVGERGRKWVGVKVWFGFIMRFEGMKTT